MNVYQAFWIVAMLGSAFACFKGIRQGKDWRHTLVSGGFVLLTGWIAASAFGIL